MREAQDIDQLFLLGSLLSYNCDFFFYKQVLQMLFIHTTTDEPNDGQTQQQDAGKQFQRIRMS